MNILHTEASTGWGGQDIRVLTECREMQARGHNIVLACARDCPLWNEAGRVGITLEAVEFGRKINLSSVLEVKRLVRRHGIDLVNPHSSADGWSATVGAKLARAKVVRTRHLSNPLKKRPANQLLYQRLTDFVITTGEPLRQALIRDNGLSPDRIRSVPTGVDVSRFDPALYDGSIFRRELGLADEDFLWTIIAVIRRAKGHEVLMDAVERWKDSHPRAHLAVVGGVTGPTPLPDALKQRARDMGMDGRIHFVGMRTDVPEILAACDGFVLPSLAEGVPQSITQALAMGVPVVATEVGGIPEVVQHEETGLLVPRGGPDALALAMQRLMDEAVLARTLAERGQSMVRQKYSQGAMIAAMEEVYQRVLAK